RGSAFLEAAGHRPFIAAHAPAGTCNRRRIANTLPPRWRLAYKAGCRMPALSPTPFHRTISMTFAPSRPTLYPVRPAALAVACALALLPAWASAQNLRELYEAARAYDATYLAARALADSANYRAAQADALNRPNVGFAAHGNRAHAHGA